MEDPVHPKSAIDPIRQEIEDLHSLRRRILASRLGKGQTPAAHRIKLDQQRARVDLAIAKGSVAVDGMLVRVAHQVNFQTCPLDEVELRGALLDIIDKATDPRAVAAFRRRDELFQATKRNSMNGGISAFVAAARPSAALVAAAKTLGLRHRVLAGGFSGRAPLDALVALGRDYSCTVRITVEREPLELVSGGVVDETVLELVAMASKGMGEEKSGETAIRGTVKEAAFAENAQDMDVVEEVDGLPATTMRFPTSALRRPAMARMPVKLGHDVGDAPVKDDNNSCE
jgi:hypothetical protein